MAISGKGMLFKMNRNKKGLHKVTANVLSLTLASVMAAGAAGEAVSSVQVYAAEASQTESVKAGTSVYLNGTLSADSKGDGTTKEKAVSSIDTALKLAGSQGTILVCGPVTISSERTLSIPSGVQIKREPSYTGAIIKITGKGKLTLSGSSLQAADVDTSAAELGTGALVQETKTEMKKEGQVTMASQVTVASPEAWSSFDFGGAGFTGEGTFSWASQTAPAEYQSSVQVVFTPKDTQNYDYSKVQGWDSGRNAVVRNVEVTIESLKPADPVVTTEEETSQQPVEESQQTEILEETEPETQKPETPEQSKPETQKPETPEQTAPEKTETEEKDTQDSHTDGNGAQTGEENTAGQVTIPEEVKLTAPEEIEKFDFAKAGFVGEGTFSWEKEFTPDTYETEVKVIFTPSDKEKKDYSQVEGWNAEKGQVIRTVKVLVESLKEGASWTTQEKEENTDQNDQKPDQDAEDAQTTSPSKEEENGDKEQTDTDKETETEKDTDIDKETEKETDTDSEETPEEKDPVKEEQESQSSEETAVEVPETEVTTEEDFVQAQPGKTGEVAQEIPQAVPVGSMIDANTGIRVEGDFLPYYVDLQVSYNEDLDQLPDAGIGQILSAYDIKLWDLKEDEEYMIPEGKKVRVMIPLPENAGSFSSLSVAHYLGNSEYEYYTLPTEEYPGTLAVINIEGIDYLTFETSSFSPFNVGGSQLVGPGTQTSQSSSSSNKNTGNSSSKGNTSAASTGTSGNSKTSGSGGASGQSVIQPSQNSGTSTNTGSTGSQTSSAAKKSESSKLIRVVRTGDNSPIVPYAAAGAAAVILGAAAVITGKRKKKKS